ncbi:MAG: hypothetical protein SLAVMIC_00830 [uncultured marine phage]|uniref:Uncharacterized protein n=1 Tax=uncultured marine phage TaxID=707152 RepID=A0A8D9C9K5_9VIRU|nr:MAG: hypothetical protein SLAVMIC_00830 [uncultured marine phage]
MGKLKKFNEYFDTEEMKSPEEIRFLQGKVKDELRSKIKEMEDGQNPDFDALPENLKILSSKLGWEVPYLNNMTTLTDKKKSLTYTNKITDESNGNTLNSNCDIRLTLNNDGSVVPEIDCYVEVNGNKIFKEHSYEPFMSEEDLIKLLKGKYFEIVNKWDEYNKSTISKKFFGDKPGMRFNPRQN